MQFAVGVVVNVDNVSVVVAAVVAVVVVVVEVRPVSRNFFIPMFFLNFVSETS